MDQKFELSTEEIEKIAGGDLRGDELNEGDILYLDTFMSIYKARGYTMDRFIAELGLGSAAAAYVQDNW